MRRDRGATLIFVLGILALLSLFAISFASVTRVERVASANYVDGIRANLAARAGIAAGIASVHDAFRQPNKALKWMGGYLDSGVRTGFTISGNSITFDNPTGIGPGDQLILMGGTKGPEMVTVSSGYQPGTNPVSLSSAAQDSTHKVAVLGGVAWAYHGHTSNMLSTGNGVPVIMSLTAPTGTGYKDFGTPSLPVNATQTLQGAVRLVSGSIGGTYFAEGATNGAGGDVYATKTLDAQGMLDANMDQGDMNLLLKQFGTDVRGEIFGIAAALKSAGVADSLLGQYLPTQDASKNDYPSPFDDGANVTAFFDYRSKLSGGRFRSKEQLKGAFYALANGDSAKGDAWFAWFRDYMSCFGDPDANDVLTDSSMSWNPPGGVVIDGNGNPDPTKIFQNKLSTAKPRIPVDINTAPVPVLVAVLLSCSAREAPTCVEDPGAKALTPISINAGLVPMAPYPSSGNGATVSVSSVQHARAMADAIVKARPFRSWHEIYKCFNTIHASGSVPDNELAAALVATCPVDLPLNLNPDRSLYYWDALDPEGATPGFKVDFEKAGSHACADFCFTSGYFEVEALGRIYADPSAPFVVAESTKRAVVNVGGVTWVRGERDLASALDPNLMGAPALNPDSAYVGGWVQPKPGETGMQAAGGFTAASGFSSWQPNLADGLLMERTQWVGSGNDVFVSRLSKSPSTTDQGSAEMWVKQPFDASKGTNEVYFMNLRAYNAGLRHAEYGTESTGSAYDATDQVILQTGVATRLERYGNQLYLCHFYWGWPDGASCGVVGEYQANGQVAAAGTNPTTDYTGGMHTYIQTAQPLRWKAGTWHHVAISWSVTTLHMWVDGVDQGASSQPGDYIGGSVWENTVKGFYPADEGGLGNNQFANLPRTTDNEATVQAAIDKANQDIKDANAAITADKTAIAADDAIINSTTTTQGAKDTASADKTAKQQDITKQQGIITAANKTISDAQAWFGGGGTGKFAEDVRGMTFTAELGLRRMKLGTHAAFMPPGIFVNSPGLADSGLTESYFLGYHNADPVKGSPPQIVTLNFTFGGDPSYYDRYANGTFDVLKWSTAPSGPAVTPHRYNVDALTYTLPVTLPTGWKAVSTGYFVILAHGLYPDDPELFGAGVNNTYSGASGAPTFSGQTVTFKHNIPAGSGCNVSAHQGGCSPGSNEVPWAIGGAWVAYEKPTVFLETPEVD